MTIVKLNDYAKRDTARDVLLDILKNEDIADALIMALRLRGFQVVRRDDSDDQ
jgi:hypothetical protein